MNKATREIALVMDLAEGGDLYDRVACAPYGEEAACRLLVLLVEAVIKLHSIGIAHRDLKLENILLRKKADDFDFCIADLGGAKWFPEGVRPVTSTETGTLGYTAPEAVSSRPREKVQYDAYQVDVFSLGVILYILLCGYPPWDLNLPPKRRPEKIVFETSHPASRKWASVSAEAKDLVNQMLHEDPTQRIPIERILSHQWIAPSKLELWCPSPSGSTGPVDDLAASDFTLLPEPGQLLVELWQNQRLRLTQNCWGPPYMRKSWTDENGGVAYSASEDMPTSVMLPEDMCEAGVHMRATNNNPAGTLSPQSAAGCCAVGLVGQEMRVLQCSAATGWQYSTAWKGFSWLSESTWRSFVRRRRIYAVIGPLDGCGAEDGGAVTDMEKLSFEESDNGFLEIKTENTVPATVQEGSAVQTTTVLPGIPVVGDAPEDVAAVCESEDRLSGTPDKSLVDCVGATTSLQALCQDAQ
eukprot:TRINITY_DN44410_c0_g1_i2.p1 TRINITY_DN44410_c0_g1~~TRINITY_DN44410_c0_g1_i2.p1  ORF type:complete len:469 (-),score=96.83 TRINITY_DN44410_c0_g1_i2:341-1747(-)